MLREVENDKTFSSFVIFPKVLSAVAVIIPFVPVHLDGLKYGKPTDNRSRKPMNPETLVQGAALAQQASGTDLLDTINTDAFKRLPFDSKVHFLKHYANTQHEPIHRGIGGYMGDTAAAVLPGAAAGGAIGLALGLGKSQDFVQSQGYHLSDLRHMHEALRDPAAEYVAKVGDRNRPVYVQTPEGHVVQKVTSRGTPMYEAMSRENAQRFSDSVRQIRNRPIKILGGLGVGLGLASALPAMAERRQAESQTNRYLDAMRRMPDSADANASALLLSKGHLHASANRHVPGWAEHSDTFLKFGPMMPL